MGAGGVAALTGAGEVAGGTAAAIGRLAAKEAVTSQVGTGILDWTGNEIMKEVTTYGPRLLEKFGSKAIPWVVDKAVRSAGWGAGYSVLKHLIGLGKD